MLQRVLLVWVSWPKDLLLERTSAIHCARFAQLVYLWKCASEKRPHREKCCFFNKRPLAGKEKRYPLYTFSKKVTHDSQTILFFLQSVEYHFHWQRTEISLTSKKSSLEISHTVPLHMILLSDCLSSFVPLPGVWVNSSCINVLWILPKLQISLSKISDVILLVSLMPKWYKFVFIFRAGKICSAGVKINLSCVIVADNN